jgi:transcription elongation factor GreA
MTTNTNTLPPVHDDRNSQSPPSGAPPSAIITRDGERALRAELEWVRHELEVGMPERLREARAFGAPADNDDYLQIQEEEIILAVRAARLEELLRRARVVESTSLDGKVAVGTVVEVRDVETGELREHELVGGHEAPRLKAVSAASPIGEALLGQEAGAVVEVQLPKGGSRRLEILRVRPVERQRP